MTFDDVQPRIDTTDDGAFEPSPGWELPELAPVFILVSVGLLVIGSGVSTGISLVGQSDIPAGFGWSLVSSALRWTDPSTSTMLLISTALIWWQYGYWSSDSSADVSDDIADVHVARLRIIAMWNLAAFVVTIASVILLIVASILQNTETRAPLQVWGYAVVTICMAVGTILLSLLGVAALRRILIVSGLVDRDEDEGRARDA